MRRIYADFNTETAEGRIALTTSGSRATLEALARPLSQGERVVLFDGEMEVEAVVESTAFPAIPGYSPERHVWLAVPDDSTWRAVRGEQTTIPGVST